MDRTLTFEPASVRQAVESSEREEALRIETVIRGSPKNLLTGVIAAAVMAWAAAADGSHTHLPWIPWLWFALIAIGLLRGTFMSLRFTSKNRTDGETVEVGDRLVRNAIYCSLIWGLASWLLLPTGYGDFLMVAMAMILMGGAAAQGVHRPMVQWFLLTTTTVFTLGLWRLGGPENTLLVVAFWLLTFVILSAARLQEQAVTQSIRLRLQLEALLTERTAQQQLTDIARAEAEAARQRAEMADQGKTTFLAAASHDLRQPMHALVQYFGVLERQIKGTELSDTVQKMGQSLNAMHELMDSILEVSKLMMGSVTPNIHTFRLASVLDSLDAQLRPLAEIKGLQFAIEAPSATVVTDEILLERILRNLLLNAIRYTNCGSVRLRCKVVRGHVQFAVSDTGIGIPQAEVPKIFEPFYQVANDARDRRKGLGLGLALVKELTQLLGHQLRLKTVEGKGTVFLLKAPMGAAGATSSPAIAPQLVRDYVRGAFVVVVDDDVPSLNATEATLRQFGCRVLSATSGLDAIGKLQGQEFMPQFIVSDYRFGGGETGIDVIRNVLQNQQALFGDEFRLAALLVSGDTAPAELARVRDAGLTMLHKPVRPTDLFFAMNDELAKLAGA